MVYRELYYALKIYIPSDTFAFSIAITASISLHLEEVPFLGLARPLVTFTDQHKALPSPR